MSAAWTQTTLGEAAEVLMGQSPPGESYNESGMGLPFMQGSAEFGEHTPNPVKWCSAPTRVAKAGDLLVSVRAPVGDTNFADQQIATGRGLAIIRASDASMNTYLRLAIQHSLAELLSRSGSGMFSSITAKELRGFPITLPSMPEQRRIVHLMSSVDRHIGVLQREAEAGRGLLEALQGRLLWAQDETFESALGDVADIQVGFAFKSDSFTDGDEDVRLLRGDNIVPGSTRWQRAKRWPSSHVNQFSSFLLKEGDLVVAMDRTWVSSGLKVAVIRESDLPALLVQRVARLTARVGLDQRLLEFLLVSPAFKSLVLNQQTGTSVPHISGKQIAAFRVRIPCAVSRQIEVAETLVAQRRYCEDLEHEVASLVELRSSMLNALLSRTIAVPEAYDQLVSEGAL